MILNDVAIRKLCRNGMVKPFRDENVQPASLDVTIWDEFRVAVPHDEKVIDLANPVDITRLVKAEAGGFVLHPGEFVLGVTEEIVDMPADVVARVEGKSSLGRLGLIVHATAGFIDPGFNGRVTLEMTNLQRLPIVLRPGKLIGQLSFHMMSAPAADPYHGRYQGDMGATESRYGESLSERELRKMREEKDEDDDNDEPYIPEV